jgi:SOS response regulatory protein OraA/RecX
MDEVYSQALKLLRRRDYTIAELCGKLEAKFGSVPTAIIHELTRKNFLNDRRFAENYIVRRKDRGPRVLRDELSARGVPAGVIEEILSQSDWLSLREALAAKMNDWQIRPPLQSRDAARLFRALLRLGYDEDAIRDEIEQVREC